MNGVLRTLGLIVIILTSAVPAAGQGTPAAHSASAEQTLADRYAPIMYLKRQTSQCDTSGEPYLPLPVDAVLDDPRVNLMLADPTNGQEDDLLVKSAPGMADLAYLGKNYYLDYPGSPYAPGCDYEWWSREKAIGHRPTTYARVATVEDDQFAMLPDLGDTEEPLRGVVVQYWFFFLFNDFNNKHEGDWEMIQVTWDVDTVEQALQTEPTSATFAQHARGETTSWVDGSVKRTDTHPQVYTSAGSHSSQFDRHVYIGWGENGTFFGCDDTSGPSNRLTPEVVLMPEDPKADSAFAWMLFRGRWGQREPWEFNGPTGPPYKSIWKYPVTWINEAHSRSLFLPDSSNIGPSPGAAFCKVSDLGSSLLITFVRRPVLVMLSILTSFVAVIWWLTKIRRHLVRAARVYWAYRGSMTSIGLIFVPLGISMTALQTFATHHPPLEWVVSVVGRSPEAKMFASTVIGGALTLLEALLIGPAVIALMGMILRNERTDARRALGEVRLQFGRLVRTWFTTNINIALKAVSLIALPFAFRDTVRWRFIGQGIMIDGARTNRGARGTSAAAVSGAWLPTALKAMMFGAIGLIPGPLIGFAMLVAFSTSIEFSNLLSSIIYAVVVPYKFIGLTLIYLDRTGRTELFLAALKEKDAEIAAKIEHDGLDGAHNTQPLGEAGVTA